jgi:hypothetical protein
MSDVQDILGFQRPTSTVPGQSGVEDILKQKAPTKKKKKRPGKQNCLLF